MAAKAAPTEAMAAKAAPTEAMAAKAAAPKAMAAKAAAPKAMSAAAAHAANLGGRWRNLPKGRAESAAIDPATIVFEMRIGSPP